MTTIHSVDKPQENFDEIEKLIEIVFSGFMALAMDYGYHINNVFGQADKGKHAIYELRDNVRYRLDSSKLHFYLLLKQKNAIERRFSKMLKENPKVFDGFYMGNPYFEHATDDIMSIYDSIIFHLSSSFDYLAMIIQFVFGKNPETHLQWITLAKHCHSKDSEFSQRVFKENVKIANNDFVSKFNDYRAELIHRKKSSSLAQVTWKVFSDEVLTVFQCSEKMKSTFKKVLIKEDDYCISYLSYLLIKETVSKIGYILEGIRDEFKTNYHPHRPKLEGPQIIQLNPTTRFPESPSGTYWSKFNEYKNFC